MIAPGNVCHAVWEAAGFELRGNRATCPFCEGDRNLTVAIRGELFYCHRCHRGGNIRQLAGSHGVTLPPPRVRKADKPKAAFRAWLSAKMTKMALREHRTYRRAVWAAVALSDVPDFEPAWSALADWYHAERYFRLFWESTSDRLGRLELYKSWRRANAR
jgi:hypothetical protein